MKNYKAISVMIVSALAFGINASAEEAGSKAVEGSIEAGYHAVGRNDSMEKTGEYDSVSSGAYGQADVSWKGANSSASGHVYFLDPEEKEFAGSVDAARIMRFDFDYSSFLHRTRHDSFHENDPKQYLTGAPKAGTPDGTFATAQHNGTAGVGEYAGVTAANPVPVNDHGTWVTEGFQTATFNDLDMGRDYAIRRSNQSLDAKFQVPAFPYFIPEIKLNRQHKEGWKQHSISVGQCTPCHAVSLGKHIDYTTDDLKLGGTFKMTNVTASFFHGITKFDAGSDRYFHDGLTDNDYWYDSVPGTGAVPDARRSRELYDGQHAVIGQSPDSIKTTDTFKLRVDGPYATTFYGSYVLTKTENDTSDYENEYKTNTYYVSLSNRIVPHLNAKAYVKHYKLDNDDINIDLAGYANDSLVLFTADQANGSQSPGFWNYERLSAMSRDITETGLDLGYNLGSGYHLSAGYTYKLEDRENKYYKDFYQQSLMDLVYLEDEQTDYHIFDLGLSARPITNVNARVDYRFQHTDNPFMFHNGLGYTEEWIDLYPNDGVNMASQNTPFYQIFRSVEGQVGTYSAGRTTDGSNMPENQHRIKGSATWVATDWLSIQAQGQYLYEENDTDSNWENNSWNAGISAHIMASQKLSFTVGYDYQQAGYTTTYSTPTYIGCFSESMSGQIASRYADVDYDVDAQILYLSSTYLPTKTIKVYGDIMAMWAKSDISVPDFGPNQTYTYYPNVGFPYSYSVMRNYLDYTGSDGYSELDYSSIEIALGTEIELYKGIGLNVNGAYRWFEDKEAYLGSDLDGEAYMINTAITYKF